MTNSTAVHAAASDAGRPPARRRPRSLRAIDWTPILLVALIGAAFFLRVVGLDQPRDALIFDEPYYVNAARVILSLPVASGAAYFGAQPGLDPNSEHPPLAKLLMAASMRAFGDNGWGWRLPSVFFGTLSIPLLYGLARRVGAGQGVALLATFVYAFDNLVFVHSRIGTLDIFLVAFLLLGLYCYLAGRPILAGLALVAATLCKITGVYGIAIIIAFEGLRLCRARAECGRWDRKALAPLLIVGVVYAVALPALLGLLDSRWSSYKNPVDHIHHILRYGFALVRPGGPQGEESNPWQWLLNDVPITYLRINTNTSILDTVNSQVTRTTIFFRGAMNPYVIAGAPLAVAYAAHSAWTRRDDCSFLVLALFFVTYGPFWPAAELGHRISYLFYFLPTLPAVALGMGQLLHAPQLPRAIRWAYIGAVLLGFYAYFPFRTIP